MTGRMKRRHQKVLKMMSNTENFVRRINVEHFKFIDRQILISYRF